MGVTTQTWVAMQVLGAQLRHEEDGSIPEWVMLLVMAVGVILAIMVFFGDSISGIVQDQLSDVTSNRPGK